MANILQSLVNLVARFARVNLCEEPGELMLLTLCGEFVDGMAKLRPGDHVGVEAGVDDWIGTIHEMVFISVLERSDHAMIILAGCASAFWDSKVLR